MAQDGKPERPWQDIATELTQEIDSERVIALAKELDHALMVDQQKSKGKAV